MKTARAYVRDLNQGAPWVASYPTRTTLDLAQAEINASYGVIYTRADEPENAGYPALEDGETLILHPHHGPIILQSIDLNYW